MVDEPKGESENESEVDGVWHFAFVQRFQKNPEVTPRLPNFGRAGNKW